MSGSKEVVGRSVEEAETPDFAQGQPCFYSYKSEIRNTMESWFGGALSKVCAAHFKLGFLPLRR